MTREEFSALVEPAGFRPFDVQMGGGLTYHVPHPEFVDLPPFEDASYVIVYQGGRPMPRFIELDQIEAVEFTAT